MKPVFLVTALLAAAPAHAGGPVITEDPVEEVAPARDRDLVLAVLLLGLVVAAAMSGGSDVCNGEPTQPPTSGAC